MASFACHDCGKFDLGRKRPSLGWGALCRPGEILSTRRSNLLLPRDVDNTIVFGLLSIPEPKMRRIGAKHQVAKLDAPDLLEIVDLKAYA